MSSPRPPSGRGRGRGRLRDHHSQSPAARNNENVAAKGVQRAPVTTSEPGKMESLEDNSSKTDRRERRERKTRRPDVQVYVPRGRRCQEVQNNSSDVPHKPSPDRQGRITAADLKIKSNKVSDSPQGTGMSVDKDSFQDKNVIGSDTRFEQHPVKKAPNFERKENSLVNEQIHLKFNEQNQSVIDDDQSFYSENSIKLDGKDSILHSEGFENEHSEYRSKTVDVMNDDPSIVAFETSKGDTNERCIKKQKVSDIVDNVPNDFSNLSHDAKLCQLADSRFQNEKTGILSHCNTNCSSEINTTDNASDLVQPSLEDLNRVVRKMEETNESQQSETSSLELPKTETDISKAVNKNIGYNQFDHKPDDVGNQDTLKAGDACGEVLCEDLLDNRNVENCGEYNDSGASEINCSSSCGCQEKECTKEHLADGYLVEINNDICKNTNKCIETKTCCDNDLHEDERYSDMEVSTNSECILRDNKAMVDLDTCGDNILLDKSCSSDAVIAEQTPVENNASDLVKPAIVSEKDSSVSIEETTVIEICDDFLKPTNDAEKNKNFNKLEIDKSEEFRDSLECSEEKNWINCGLEEKEIYQSNNVGAVSPGNKTLTLKSCDMEDKIDSHPILTEEFQGSEVMAVKTDSKEVESSTEGQSEDKNVTAGDQSDEDSWDTMFDDNGDCLDPSAMEELVKTVGKVKIQKSKKINYLDYKPKDKSAELDYADYGHIIEIFDFPKEFVTRDLIIAFQSFMSRGFDLKWVDDTHALGIFSSSIAAQDALNMVHPLLKVCPLSLASPQSKSKAKRCTEFLQPYKPRPETTAAAARRLVAGALGLQSKIPKEQRDKERQQLKEAKAKKRQDRQNRDDIWEGRLGRCAMDEEG